MQTALRFNAAGAMSAWRRSTCSLNRLVPHVTSGHQHQLVHQPQHLAATYSQLRRLHVQAHCTAAGPAKGGLTEEEIQARIMASRARKASKPVYHCPSCDHPIMDPLKVPAHSKQHGRTVMWERSGGQPVVWKA